MHSELYNSDISKEDWFVDFFYVITAFVFYKIITRNLELEKGKFSLFGKKQCSNISKVLKGERKMHKGYVFKYEL